MNRWRVSLQICRSLMLQDRKNISFSVGNKIEHMVGEHTLKADRIWEPGGCLVKTDRQMLQTEAVLHGQVQFSGPEKLKNDKLQSCIGLNLCEFRVDHGVDILFSHQMHRVKEIYVLPKKILSQACPYQKAHLVWEQGGSVGKQAPWNCLDKYLKHGVVLQLNAKTHETCLHNTLEVFSAEETQIWMVN
ncbi:unnamed protein product [Brassica oleracea]